MRWSAVILAAGQGTRLRSRIPKVLHELAGRPLIQHVLETATAAVPAERICVVVGHGREAVAAHLEPAGVRLAVQEPQRGTGEALAIGLAGLEPAPSGGVLVLSGDVPLVRPATLRALREPVEAGAAAAVLTARLPEPGSYGRVIRGADGAVDRIVEARDASPEELAVTEVNAGLYGFRRAGLAGLLAGLRPENSQGEYYLTDVVAALRGAGERVAAVPLADPEEMLGVNTRADLARVAAALNRRVLQELMASGVTVVDPASTWVEPGCLVGRDTVLEPGVVLRQGARIGRGARIGAHSVIEALTVPDGASVPPLSYLAPAGGS